MLLLILRSGNVKVFLGIGANYFDFSSCMLGVVNTLKLECEKIIRDRGNLDIIE